MTTGETTGQTAADDANADRGIRLTLVQYGRLARVGWFGTVHAIDVKYGDAVVVETMEGCWLGRVLGTGSVASQAKQESERSIRGELLRKASVPDFEEMQRQAERGAGLRLRANAALASRSLTQVVLDVDVAVDGRTAILQFAGSASVELGTLAVRLAEAEGLGRVRWLSVLDSESATPTVEQDAEETKFSDSIDTALQRLRSGDPKSLVATSAEERQVLGLLGAYPQKIRDHETPTR